MRTDEARPLDRYPLVNTSIADEMQAALSQTYAKPAIEFIDGDRAIRTTVNHRQLRHVGLIYASFGASLHLRYPETDLAAQIFSVGGKGEARTGGASVAINRDCSVVISPREPLDVTSDPQFQRLVLTLKSGSLASKLAAIVGEPCDGVLKFDPAQNYALASARALRSHFLFLVETMNAFGSSIPGVALAEFEQTLIVMFLHANRNNYSDLLEQNSPAAGAWQVRNAEEFIEASCRQAIALEDICDAGGAGVLCLSRAFKRARGCSLKEFADQVRLRHARRLLLDPDAATTVAAAASACGFADLGWFENAYILAFGESPAATLQSARGAGQRPH